MPEMSRHRYRILLVDDDARLRDLLNRYLSEQGFSVKPWRMASRWIVRCTGNTYDLMVLDLMPRAKTDWLSVAVCARLENTPPIVMLTAKGDDVDRIVGLSEMGQTITCQSRSIPANR